MKDADIGRDITERKKAEALRESETMLHELVESATEGIAAYDSELNLVVVNKAALAIFPLGITAENLKGRNILEISPGLKGTARYNQYLNIVKTGKPLFFEDLIPRTVFGDRHLSLRAFRVGDGLGIIFTDITESKKAEEERNRLLKAMETTKEAVNITTPDAVIIYTNPALDELFGYERGELIGKHVSVLNADGQEMAGEVTTEVVKIIRETGVWEGEVYNKRKDGTKFISQVKVTLLLDERGGIINYVASQHDITESKKAEEQLLEYQNRLRALSSQLPLVEERERKRIATLLHDKVCQILGLVAMKLGSIGSANLQPEVMESVSEAGEMLKQALETTRTLLSDLRPTLLYDLGLEAAVDTLVENMVKWQDNIKPVFEDDGQSKPLDDRVRTLLYQSVSELLMNIIKHAKASKAKVSIRKEGNKISIVVEDDGIGFKTSQVIGEAGHFGLFSVCERMRSLGGKCEVESETDQGTRITLLAPLSE